MKPVDPKSEESYRASREHATLVDVPDEQFISVDGHGSPHGPAFMGAIRALYAVAFGLKFALRKETGEDHVVAPLEALWWWSEGERFPAANEKEWRWRLMIRQPPAVTRDMVKRTIETAREKHPEMAVDLVKLRHYHEGRSMQILHVGPYKDEAHTIERLQAEMRMQGYEPAGMHHEVYLGDPRRAKPERLKTILRQPVRPIRARASLTGTKA